MLDNSLSYSESHKNLTHSPSNISTRLLQLAEPKGRNPVYLSKTGKNVGN